MSHERAYDRLTVVDGLGVKFYVIPTLPLVSGGGSVLEIQAVVADHTYYYCPNCDRPKEWQA